MHKFIVLTHDLRMGASTVLSVVYDLPTVSSPDDPIVTKVNAFMAGLSHYGIPGEVFGRILHLDEIHPIIDREMEERG